MTTQGASAPFVAAVSCKAPAACLKVGKCRYVSCEKYSPTLHPAISSIKFEPTDNLKPNTLADPTPPQATAPAQPEKAPAGAKESEMITPTAGNDATKTTTTRKPAGPVKDLPGGAKDMKPKGKKGAAPVATINAGKAKVTAPKKKAEPIKHDVVATAKTAPKAAAPKKETKPAAPRAPKGTTIEPASEALPVRAGTKVAAIIDLLARPNGATYTDLAAALSKTGQAWDEKGVRNWLGWDVKNKGYGVRTDTDKNPFRLYLVLPKGLKAPLPHTPRAGSAK